MEAQATKRVRFLAMGWFLVGYELEYMDCFRESRDIPDRSTEFGVKRMGSRGFTIPSGLAVASLQHALEEVITLFLGHVIRELDDNTVTLFVVAHVFDYIKVFRKSIVYQREQQASSIAC
jgi:hypothetical protein